MKNPQHQYYNHSVWIDQNLLQDQKAAIYINIAIILKQRAKKKAYNVLISELYFIKDRQPNLDKTLKSSKLRKKNWENIWNLDMIWRNSTAKRQKIHLAMW